MAADQGGRLGSDSLRSTTEVILELTDINDNAPFLTNVSILFLFIVTDKSSRMAIGHLLELPIGGDECLTVLPSSVMKYKTFIKVMKSD